MTWHGVHELTTLLLCSAHPAGLSDRFASGARTYITSGLVAFQVSSEIQYGARSSTSLNAAAGNCDFRNSPDST